MTVAREGWASAVANLEEACKLLTAPSPEHLDGSARLLEAAVAELRSGTGAGVALSEAQSLQELVRRAGGLLEGAAEYHRKWAALAGSLTAGYAAGGRPGEYVRPGMVSMQG